MKETLLRACPKCGARVRIREEEDTGRCEACNTMVPREGLPPGMTARVPEGQRLTPTVVLVGSLALIVAGALSVRAFRKPSAPLAKVAPDPVYTAPPRPTAEAAPAGEIAWEPEARAPVVVQANGDDVEDIFGFFRVWDGRSAWTMHGGVFDGTKLTPLWQTDAIDPQLLKRRGALPSAVVVGKRLVMSDATPTLRVYDVATGTKLLSLALSDTIVAMCKAPDPAARVWVEVAGDQHATVDLDTGKVTPAPKPAWCPLPDPPARDASAGKRKPGQAAATPRDAGPPPDATQPDRACQDDFHNLLARAECLPGDEVSAAGAKGGYVLRSGTAAALLATKDDRPLAVGVGAGFRPSWTTPLVADDTKPTPEAPRVAELFDGRLYATVRKLYFDARLVALDAASGARVWDVPLVGSLPSGTTGDVGRGDARGLLASKSRVYVARTGGGLDVFDAADGKAIGTIGRK